jgi:hypothetical protein
MLVESQKKLSGNDRFEGFTMDLATELSKLLYFNFTFKLVSDGAVSHLQHLSTFHKLFSPAFRLENIYVKGRPV